MFFMGLESLILLRKEYELQTCKEMSASRVMIHATQTLKEVIGAVV